MKRSPLTRRKGLKRGKPLRRTKSINARSAHKAKQLAAWWHHDFTRRVKERDRDCRAPAFGAPTPCEPGRRQVHHILTKARGGGDTMDNLVLLCPHHHDWVHHKEPKLALQLGLLRSQFDKSDTA